MHKKKHATGIHRCPRLAKLAQQNSDLVLNFFSIFSPASNPLTKLPMSVAERILRAKERTSTLFDDAINYIRKLLLVIIDN